MMERSIAMFLSSRNATLGLILAVAAIGMISVPAKASDPAAGTWELNLAKSVFTNIPAPKSETRTYEVTEQQSKMIGKGISSQGDPYLIEFTANRDGKDYPYTGTPTADAISITPVDASTVNWTTKKAGKVVLTGTRVISKDGKVMTISGKGTDAKGQPMEVILVFDKR
jgi:hypothetical protein